MEKIRTHIKVNSKNMKNEELQSPLAEALQLFSQYAHAYQKLEDFQEKNPLIIPKGDQKTGAIGEFWGLKILQKEFPSAEVKLGHGHSQKGFDAIVKFSESEVRFFQIKTISEFSKTGISSKIHSEFTFENKKLALNGILVIFLEKNMIQGKYILLDRQEDIKCLNGKRIRKNNYKDDQNLKSFKFSVLSLID